MRFAFFLIFVALSAPAHNLVIDQRVPPVGIATQGELLLDGGKIVEHPWNSSQLSGKVRVLFYLAGRISVKNENAPLIAAITKASFPHDSYQTTTIVNTDDAIPGSAIFVYASLKAAKRDSPWSQFIIDNHGAAKRLWQLKSGGTAIVVLDSAGKVRFAREGALTSAETEQVMLLLRNLLNQTTV